MTHSKIAELSSTALLDELASEKVYSKLKRQAELPHLPQHASSSPSSLLASSSESSTHVSSSPTRLSATRHNSTASTPPLELPSAAEPTSFSSGSVVADRLTQLQAAIRNVSGCTAEPVRIVSGAAEFHDRIQIYVPVQLLKVSGTLSHIHASMKPFREGRTSRIELPKLDPIVLLDAIEYMSATSRGEEEKFSPAQAHLLELMDAAVYLDLPGLVNICGQQVALHLFDVESFGDLTSACIRNILRRAMIPQLCWAERGIFDTQNNPTIRSIWHSRYLNFLENYSDSIPPLPIDSRNEAIKHYVEMSLSAPLSKPQVEALLYVLQLEGPNIQELNIGTAPWEACGSRQRMRRILNLLPACRKVTVTLRKLNPSLLNDVVSDATAWKRCLTLEIPVRESVGLIPLAYSQPQERIDAKSMDRGGMAVMIQKGMYLEVTDSHTSARQVHSARQQHQQANIEAILPISVKLLPSTTGFSRQEVDSFLAISTRVYISELDMRNVLISQQFHSRLCSLLQSETTRLTILNLSNTHIPNTVFITLFQSLHSYQYLIDLDISSNLNSIDSSSQQTEAAQYLSKYMMSPNCRLQRLDVSSTRLGASGLLSLLEGVGQCKPLQHLNLANTDMAPVSSALHRCVINKPLKFLDLSGNSLPPRMLLTVLGNGTTTSILDCVEILNLNGCLWNEEAIESLSRSLGHFQCKVKKLHLAGDSLTHALEDNGC
ncbi:hypothetical protein SeMB42_g07949, partial [Synchytrium endobioticum]